MEEESDPVELEFRVLREKARLVKYLFSEKIESMCSYQKKR
jgi:hypothetical protein